jgi:hypothetical protein
MNEYELNKIIEEFSNVQSRYVGSFITSNNEVLINIMKKFNLLCKNHPLILNNINNTKHTTHQTSLFVIHYRKLNNLILEMFRISNESLHKHIEIFAFVRITLVHLTLLKCHMFGCIISNEYNHKLQIPYIHRYKLSTINENCKMNDDGNINLNYITDFFIDHSYHIYTIDEIVTLDLNALLISLRYNTCSIKSAKSVLYYLIYAWCLNVIT